MLVKRAMATRLYVGEYSYKITHVEQRACWTAKIPVLA